MAALQQHASEVTDFVNDGMAAMRAAMMKNGGMMQPGMHDGMMGNAPQGKTPQPPGNGGNTACPTSRHERDRAQCLSLSKGAR